VFLSSFPLKFAPLNLRLIVDERLFFDLTSLSTSLLFYATNCMMPYSLRSGVSGTAIVFSVAFAGVTLVHLFMFLPSPEETW
jgi:hypothetical protein